MFPSIFIEAAWKVQPRLVGLNWEGSRGLSNSPTVHLTKRDIRDITFETQKKE